MGDDRQLPPQPARLTAASYTGLFPGGTVLKKPPAHGGDARDAGSIPGLGRSPGVGKGNPLQYACMKNSTDRGAWQATVHGVKMSQTRLSKQATIG